MREVGIAEEDLPEYLIEAESFGVFEENIKALNLFLNLNRRWLIAEMSGSYLRLDDQAIKVQMELRGIKQKHRAKLLDQLMAMESAALEILNKAEPDKGASQDGR